MAQLQTNDALRRWRQTGLAVLMGASACAAATDYPPPPGAYHSEPMVLRELPATPPPPAGSSTERVFAPQADASSKRLAIPQLNPTRERGTYDAANLFGSAETIRQDDHRSLVQPLPNRDPAPIEPPHAAQTNDDTRGFAMDFRRGNGAAANRDVPRYGQGAAYYGYPQYAPAYPAYGQYPGQGMQYAPPTARDALHPGYPNSHGPGDPRGATGAQGFAAPPTGRTSYPTMGPGIQAIRTQAPFPTVGSPPDYPRRHDPSEVALGTTFRAVTPDDPSGASHAPAGVGADRSDGGATLPGSTMMFRPPELLPGR